jgi:hypothetical protein
MSIVRALQNLRPGASWEVNGNTYEGITWRSENTTEMPSYDEITAEIERIKQQDRDTQYRLDRMHKYPPIGDQLDALWKGGDAAAEMLARVQAVKAQYPKPEEV